MFLEIIKFILYLIIIVIISKYILVNFLRKLAEALNLSAKTIGNIAGFATSVPELLITCTSCATGLGIIGIYNILSSNVINLIQYLGTVILNNNVNQLKKDVIRTNMSIVVITIIIPIVLLITKRELDLRLIPFLVITYILSILLSRSLHKLYLKEEDKEVEIEIKKEIRRENRNKKTVVYLIILSLTAILLFVIGELLGDSLEELCKTFNISQVLIGILLGFFTSVPEFIAFFEAQKENKKKDQDILGMVEATNNLIVSNSINLFVVLTLGILISNIY